MKKTTIVLKPVPLSAGLLSRLERRGLVRMLKPTKKVLNTRTRTGAVDTFYVSAADHGPHLLMGIGKRSERVVLQYHRDNEEFILLNPAGRRFKPLYLIVGLHPRPALERKLAAGTLGAADFCAVEVVYNDPATCVFTMMKDTVHCEVTAPGRGQHPVFFVTEPARMRSHRFLTRGFEITVQGK